MNGVPEETRADASVCLTKPVLPDVLLGNIRRLVSSCAELRERSELARVRTEELTSRSEQLDEKSLTAASELAGETSRPCPGCGRPLEWIERGRLGQGEYDYYHWCAGGCGLYCFDRCALHWIKLV